MKINRVLLTYIMTLIVALLLVVPAVFDQSSNLKLSHIPVHNLNQNWFYENANGLNRVTLPAKLAVKENEASSISIVLGTEFNDTQFLCVRSSLQTIRLYLDQQLIYENKFESTFKNTPAISEWNLIKIPENSGGKQLELEAVSPFLTMSGKFNPITYGTRGDLILNLIDLHLPSLLLTFVIFLSGLFMFLIPLTLKQYKKWETTYLGLFAMSISLWFFSESKMTQLFTSSPLFIGGSAYMLLSLFPVPLILYIKESVILHTKKYYSCFAGLLLINSFLVILLQLLGIMPFFDSLLLTHVLIASASLMAIITFFYEIKRHHNKKATRFMRAISLLILFAGLEMVNFYLGNFMRTSVYTKIGLILFIMVQSMDSIAQMIEMIKKSYVAEMYEKLAFEDQLTGGANRMAFEKALEHIFSEPDVHRGTRLVILDLNQLKKINDTWGHTSGDEAIRTSFECIEHAFGDIGSCYRLGGDEFAVLLSNGDVERYQQKIDLMHQYLKTASIQLPFSLGLAVGSVCYEPETDTNAKLFMHRADMKMYEDK